MGFLISPVVAIRNLWGHRSLLHTLIRRDVVGRYQGSVAGLLWSFFNPLFMLAVYTFFFGFVFKSKWTGGNWSKTEFAITVFAGLILFNFFVECIARSPTLVVSNVNFVKKVVFPLDVLPVIVIGSALFHSVVSTLVWGLFYLVFWGVPHVTIFLFPFVFVPLILFALGFSWFLSSLGVYLRDVSQVVTVLTGALMFLSPVFYPVSAMPPRLRIVLNLNPLTPAIEQARGVLILGQGLPLIPYFISLVAGVFVAWMGFFWFQKTRSGFADVL